MDKLTAPSLKAAFERQPVILQLNSLDSSRPLPKTATHSRKFLRILASIAAIGLVEPLIVARMAGDAKVFSIVDGRLRVEALRRLGNTEALCLIAADDETYTCNKHISRLTSAQEARMIAKAIERSVSSERIALVLGVGVNAVKRKAGLLDGISQAVAGILAEKSCPATTLKVLKLMKPRRQLKAAELMCGQGNFTSAFARAIVAATPPDELERTAGVPGEFNNEVVERLSALERELVSLQTTVAHIDERYGIEHLHLAVSAAYVATLLSNERVVSRLREEHPDLTTRFETITREVRDARSISDASGPRSKSFRSIGGKTA